MRLVALLTATLFFAACDTTPNIVKDDPSYAADIKPAFDSRCVSCHSGSNPDGHYPMSTRADLFDPGTDTVPNVIAGDAAASRLYQSIESNDMPPLFKLDTFDKANVRNWINQGAKDN